VTLLLAFLLSGAAASADLPQITIEAEDYAEVTGGTVRVLDRADASGGQCVSYWEEPGVAVTCGFDVAEAGDYCLTLRYALNWPDTRREVRIDGAVVPGLEDVRLPGTGSWADFRMLMPAGSDGGPVLIPLEAGAHTITLSNVHSRGLAWDSALLHGLEDPPTDVPMSRFFLANWGDHAEAVRALLLRGEVDDDRGFTLGDVAVLYDDDGPVAAAKVGALFFDWHVDVVYPTCERTTMQFGSLVVSPLTSAGWPGVSLLIADSRNLHLIHVSTGSGEPGEETMRGPHLIWRDGQPFAPAPARYVDREPSKRLTFDGMQITAPTPLVMRREPLMKHDIEIAWPRLHAGRLHVAAVKIGPRLHPGNTAIDGLVEGDEIVIRSSTDMPPALAQFYGIPRFEVRVRPDASMTITTDAGETLALPAPGAP